MILINWDLIKQSVYPTKYTVVWNLNISSAFYVVSEIYKFSVSQKYILLEFLPGLESWVKFKKKAILLSCAVVLILYHLL